MGNWLEEQQAKAEASAAHIRAANSSVQGSTKTAEDTNIVQTLEFAGEKVDLTAAQQARWQQIETAAKEIFQTVAASDDTDNIPLILQAVTVFQSEWLRGDKKYLSVYRTDYVRILAVVFECPTKTILSWADGKANGLIPELLEARKVLMLREFGFGRRKARVVDLYPVAIKVQVEQKSKAFDPAKLRTLASNLMDKYTNKK